MAAPRVWLITGTSSGFGQLLAQLAASRGDNVLAASRTPQKLAQLEASSDRIKPVRLDHNESLPQIKAAVDDIFSIHGKVDIVVNNAAYVQTGMLEETTQEETMNQFEANTTGPLNLYRALLPHLREQGSGTLVTIGSMAAWYTMAGFNLYNASKAALRWLALGLGEEVAQFGIRHCLVEPGFFRTELLNPSANIGKTDKSSRISAYSEVNKTTDGNVAAFHGAQLGNPEKGAEIIYDVVTSSGVAAGRELPDFLPLGSDACDEIRKAATKTIDAVEEWRKVSSLSDIADGQ